MCLDKIYKTKPRKTGTGAKVFTEWQNELFGELQGEDRKPRPYNTWLLARDFSYGKNKPLMSNTWEPYRSGWHIFKNLKSARVWKGKGAPGSVIRRVKYRNAFVCGNQIIWHSESITKKSTRGDIVVADEIYIYKEEIK